ncbi:hypothetical protein H6G74_25900 [Nostoc spongiaeforme FACHB-130]|uniref:Uncharacterized protein n=1 Tax=Nostoc spongiaeforme FACHB-130 TaxID=1357510 RepID=A0ABR8G3B2_9NOSO|nr:hypothetical protein [Nostoc spongiaeforme]MBD2597731.1 hypothetical protein [Nostoc spongiaeforme FACHB-130]
MHQATEVARQMLQVGKADDSRLKSGNPPTALSPQRTGSATQTKPALRQAQ